MKPFSQQESVMNAALNHYFHDHDETRKKVCFSRYPARTTTSGGPISPGLLSSSSYTFKSGLTRKQKKIFALVKLMKKLNDRRSFFTAKIPVPEFETKPTPRPKNKDRGQI